MKNLAEQQDLFAQDVIKLLLWLKSKGYNYSLGEVLRTPEQAAIYAKEGKGIINSLHCKKLAIDINLFDKDYKYITDILEYQNAGLYWESLNRLNKAGSLFVLKHGGSKVDADHFQRDEE